MKRRMMAALIVGIVVMFTLAVWLWAAANLDDRNCCSQQWIDSAPDAATRALRNESRASRVSEAERFERKCRVAALSCLAGAAGLSVVYFWRRRREVILATK